MPVKISSFFLIIGILFGSVESGALAGENTHSNHNYAFPTDPFSFQQGPGQEIANTYCVICHSAEYIYMQPEHSEKKWQAIITKMKHVFGCPIAEEQILSLATYLFQQNSISPIFPTPSR